MSGSTLRSLQSSRKAITPANYRPTRASSVCCKTIEHIVHSHVMKHLEHQVILTDSQHGFRKTKFLKSQLVLTIKDIASSLYDGDQIDAVLQDFSKALDKVPHKRLSMKLDHYVICNYLLKWMLSFLSNRSQEVLVEGHTSSSAPVTSGVPQGYVLCPRSSTFSTVHK